jgi:hypothetical protein
MTANRVEPGLERGGYKQRKAAGGNRVTVKEENIRITLDKYITNKPTVEIKNANE